MQIYTYSPLTGEYMGTDEARESPLEPGAYLVPANATAVAPPDAQAGYALVWDGSAWQVVEDHRRETVYATATGEARTISEIGPLPDGVTTTAPGDYQKWDAATSAWVTDTDKAAAGVRAERNARLAATDWTQLADCPLSDTRKAAYATSYRQPLRDLPSSWTDFPGTGPDDPNCPWPTVPTE